jgi:hypothetical protein
MNWVRDIKQEAKSIHMVSAWATENQLVFAQVQTEAKSNEITAIPALLEQIAVSDDVGWLVKQFPQWKSVKSIGVVESTRDAGDGGKTERRYFISSLGADEELFAHAGEVAPGDRKPAALYA